MAKVTLAALNVMEQDAFVEALGKVFEHSPWVAEKAFVKRPFSSVEELHDAMMAVLGELSEEELTRFFCLHPELAGKELEAGELTEHSSVEQARAGLDALHRDEVEELQRGNALYRERHGFPFIACVRHYTKEGIFYELERRTHCSTEKERDTALRNVGAISCYRLHTTVAEGAHSTKRC